VNWVFTEVNDGGLYRDDCSFDDIYAFFRARGFRLKHLAMTRHRWGNALFGRDCSRPAVR
jgi:hypothetical protein